MTQKKQKPVIPKPRKEVPCPASPDPDEAGRNYARAITSPEVAAYRVTMSCEQPDLTAQIDVPGMLRMFKDQGEAFSRGDMQHAEAMLSSQATALQTLFARLTERAMGQTHLPNLEALMRLALRAQSQSRATLETLTTIKNPPIVYARQANVTTGPQQINNGAPASSRTRQTEAEQNKLSAGDTHGLLSDPRASGATSKSDTMLATLGTLDGAEVGRGQSGRGAQRRQRLHPPATP